MAGFPEWATDNADAADPRGSRQKQRTFLLSYPRKSSESASSVAYFFFTAL
jgi:hypothetical protein